MDKVITNNIGKAKDEKIPLTDLAHYKETLGNLLREHMMTADKIAQDSDMKTYIENYAMENVINCKAADALLGIVKKFAHMEIKDANGTLVFPIIHAYKGHNLLNTVFFYKDENGACTTGTVQIKPSTIIIP